MRANDAGAKVRHRALRPLACSVAVLALLGANTLVAGGALAEPVRVEAVQMPSFADVVAAVRPAIVSVQVEQKLGHGARRGFRFDRRLFEDESSARSDDEPDFGKGADREDRRFHRFGRGAGMGMPHPPGGRVARSGRVPFGMNSGSGFFVSEDGYVVTDHHVVENGVKFTVVLEDGTELEAALVGADARSNLAVLKVNDPRKFTYVKFADKPVRVGDWAVTVANPYGLGVTVSAGIVASSGALPGPAGDDDLLQIDSGSGGLGGPVFDATGQVVGIDNTRLPPFAGHGGAAFAIPAAAASAVVNDLIANGQVVRGWLGVQIQPVTPDLAESVGLSDVQGAIVTNPQEGSPAAKAGIKAGDVITAVDGEKVRNPRDLARRIGSLEPESKVTVTVWRDNAPSDIEVMLGKLESREGDRPGPQSGVSQDDRPLLGLELEADPSGEGVRVVDVLPDGPAAMKGIRPGEVIVSVGGVPVDSADAVIEAMEKAADGGRNSALFQLRRGDNLRFLAMPLSRD